MGKQTGIKFVPTLTFVADIVPDTARELEEALERARHADAELARAREGAQYAGEADPYRKPAEDDEDDDLADLDTVVPGTADESADDVRRPEQECTVSEVDPDPFEPGEGQRHVGARRPRGAGHRRPHRGGKRGQIGETPSIARRRAGRRLDATRSAAARSPRSPTPPPVADPGPDA